ncbi:glycosyltransferase family 49 protein [Laetiporus sulphureus 93-53]|uniref:Glycosyltransferase family 49 protein n=1 Tax=Laetiporus sulphureus 93-53 TaxID=1314785 RepID=A0A165DRC6_9APHY|nr:glycosyltransferase family 49 protein [Laetiporus sulphureus 93-53]KZT05466.1 glycosyltransferase family 49 protein [Laetiporus sulphureus 93-53]
MPLYFLIAKSIQLCLLVYVGLAALYTTRCILSSPYSPLSAPNISRFPTSWARHTAPTSPFAKSSGLPASQDLNTVPLPIDISDALWPASLSPSSSNFRFFTSALVQRLGLASSVAVREETLLAKAFSGALHPTRIIPFYYRANGKVDDGDVTITTLVTANRFRVFRQLVERYQGPISVTIHIPFPAHASLSTLPASHPSVTALQHLHTLYTSSPLFAQYVDVHLALSPFAAAARGRTENEGEGEGGRQFNVWRNVARLFARTEFVMILDVDFAVCTDWRGAVRDAIVRAGVANVSTAQDEGITMDLASGELVQRLRDGNAALVVPAFEYVNLDDGVDQRSFPADKESLLKLTRASPPVITAFHASWAPGHNSTDYPRYDAIAPGSGAVYRASQYQSAYEPYVIVSKRVSWCDERFTGYGANKAACLFEMYLSGVSFYVLADHFLIHQSHTYEEEARREERKYNRRLYADFKEEACLRYIERYAREGTLHTPRGYNVQEECKKIKSVARIAGQLLDRRT